MRIPNGRLGVIGGCGVFAGIEFLSRLERKFIELEITKESDQPEVIMFQANRAPDRIKFASGEGESFAKYFVDIGLKLKHAGATFCCMPCNTAHVAINEIEKVVGLPFVNIIAETALHIEKNFTNANKIGILCSNGTKKSRLFDEYFDKTSKKLHIIYPDDLSQELVAEGINDVKAGDFSVSDKFLHAAYDMIFRGAEVIILGCTEIPLAVQAKTLDGVAVVDTLNVLVDACVERFFR